VWQGSDFTNGQMPTQLDGVSVTVNGKPAYVYYISPTQVNILTPPDPMPGAGCGGETQPGRRCHSAAARLERQSGGEIL
jgi:uncharacterized protein (TIGR03437 family)